MIIDPLNPPGRHASLTGVGIEPWLTREFIELFKTWPTALWSMAEWGSGGGSIWFAQRVMSVVTVENDLEFAEALRPHLPPNVEYKACCGVAYIHALADLQDLSLDFLLIDGRQRHACALVGMPKVKHGGIVALDNAERAAYAPILELLDQNSQSCQRTTNGRWRTDFWVLD
ncbi:MAG: hypothetical protein KJ587_19610 [Alphaproteobacteria bacterium]|nr:hypothetical protein [Alphaproteobacteria bacterium]